MLHSAMEKTKYEKTYNKAKQGAMRYPCFLQEFKFSFDADDGPV